MKLALMLMAGSALVFVGLMGIYYNTHTFDMVEIGRMGISLGVQKFFFPFVFLGFGIFAALFPFHTWVPDGHASAPTAASMFLAGISMKLGGYGCLRMAALMPDAAHSYSWIIILLATIAIIYGAFATMMQKDLKYINAYSSVSHCGFVLLGIGMLTKTAMVGAVMQMVSHGLMTALLAGSAVGGLAAGAVGAVAYGIGYIANKAGAGINYGNPIEVIEDTLKRSFSLIQGAVTAVNKEIGSLTPEMVQSAITKLESFSGVQSLLGNVLSIYVDNES
jgi:NADH:ubiquinone oxidoreductase subunit 4 (subunit M)